MGHRATRCFFCGDQEVERCVTHGMGLPSSPTEPRFHSWCTPPSRSTSTSPLVLETVSTSLESPPLFFHHLDVSTPTCPGIPMAVPSRGASRCFVFTTSGWDGGMTESRPGRGEGRPHRLLGRPGQLHHRRLRGRRAAEWLHRRRGGALRATRFKGERGRER